MTSTLLQSSLDAILSQDSSPKSTSVALSDYIFDFNTLVQVVREREWQERCTQGERENARGENDELKETERTSTKRERVCVCVYSTIPCDIYACV